MSGRLKAVTGNLFTFYIKCFLLLILNYYNSYPSWVRFSFWYNILLSYFFSPNWFVLVLLCCGSHASGLGLELLDSITAKINLWSYFSNVLQSANNHILTQESSADPWSLSVWLPLWASWMSYCLLDKISLQYESWCNVFKISNKVPLVLMCRSYNLSFHNLLFFSTFGYENMDQGVAVSFLLALNYWIYLEFAFCESEEMSDLFLNMMVFQILCCSTNNPSRSNWSCSLWSPICE